MIVFVRIKMNQDKSFYFARQIHRRKNFNFTTVNFVRVNNFVVIKCASKQNGAIQLQQIE